VRIQENDVTIELDHPDHLDEIFAALRAVATLFRAGVRQGEAYALEGTDDVRVRIGQFEERLKAAVAETLAERRVALGAERLQWEKRLKEVLHATVSDVWTEVSDEVQAACRRAGVFG